MESGECTCSDKQIVENTMIEQGDELINANGTNGRTKTIPSNEDVDNYSELSATSVRSRRLTEKGQEEKIRHLKYERITALIAVSRIRTEERLSDQLDRISEARSSQRTHSSRKSQKSRSSGRAQERAKVAELLVEKSMLKTKLELEVVEKEFVFLFTTP